MKHSEDAYRHILQLATLARDGTLATNLTSPNKDNEDNYCLKATIYTLILPMAIFRLLHSNLTLYDLELDTNFKFQYILAKCLYFSCSNSFDIAVGDKQNPETCLICSDLHLRHPKEHMIKCTDDKKELQSVPHHHHIPYNELGIHRDTTDNLVSSVIFRDTKGDNKIERAMTFAEFEENVFNKTSKDLEKICDIFLNFNPDNEDYLLVWRILIVQACIYWVINNIRRTKKGSAAVLDSKRNHYKSDISDVTRFISDFIENDVRKFLWVQDKKCEEKKF
jgi:hypothetical protein